MPRVSRQALREADLTFTWKLVVRICAIVMAVIAIGLLAWAEAHNVTSDLDSQVANSPAYEGGYAQENWGDGDDLLLPWNFIPLGLSIIWNIANIGVWFTPSRSGRGMHPGANVGCDLILWLILILTGTFASFADNDYLSPWNEYNLDYNGETFSNGTHFTYAPNGTEVIDPNQCAPFISCNAAADYNHALNHKGAVIAAGVAFTFIIMLLHFALFISACRYTHARRYEKGQQYAKAVTVEATALATNMIRDMGYGPPGPWPTSPPPQTQWSPYGQQQFMAAPMVQPYSTQPKSEVHPAERELQQGYQQQAVDARQQQSLGKGKGREENLELGFQNVSPATDDGSNRQYPPHVRLEEPNGVEGERAGFVR